MNPRGGTVQYTTKMVDESEVAMLDCRGDHTQPHGSGHGDTPAAEVMQRLLLDGKKREAR